jgi:hypothetical protein
VRGQFVVAEQRPASWLRSVDSPDRLSSLRRFATGGSYEAYNVNRTAAVVTMARPKNRTLMKHVSNVAARDCSQLALHESDLVTADSSTHRVALWNALHVQAQLVDGAATQHRFPITHLAVNASWIVRSVAAVAADLRC